MFGTTTLHHGEALGAGTEWLRVRMKGEKKRESVVSRGTVDRLF
jgi:hypothetical protein